MFPANGSSEFWNIYICILHREQQQSKFLIQKIIYMSTSQAIKDELFSLLRPNSNLDTKSGLEWQSTRDYPKRLLSPSIFGLWSSTPSSIPNQNDRAQIINTQSSRQIRITSPSWCIGAHFLADLQTKEELLNPRFKGPVKPAFIGEVNIPGVDNAGGWYGNAQLSAAQISQWTEFSNSEHWPFGNLQGLPHEASHAKTKESSPFKV
ncbi:conserved hypothetical protein [Coccidioides posadasii str. Silveira]|uniref:Uncharacterized protein n=1 Tax=Coccidioides posadasii (strain RMSCC 757 / Silveira) TaxID=443226 RepID=E9DC05_COCPS|nr:conserved hypothetical protein [Coccidioides posadasii str. Silveira]